MTDTVAPEVRSRIMAAVKGKNTTPELRVRRALHAAGFRFRLHRQDIPGRPDLVLPRYRMAVFVHGCFWHWHGCRRSRMPATNAAYWRAKIERNIRRDARNRAALESQGWDYAILWECELPAAAEALVAHLAQRRGAGG